MRNVALVAIAVLAIGLARFGSPAPRAQVCTSTVAAFYYPWYGGPPNYRHWSSASGDDRYRHYPPATISAEDDPVLGPYNSLQSKTIDSHLGWAQRAGIDVLVSSWWGPGGYEDRGFDLLLRRLSATRSPVRATIYFESPGVFSKPGYGADVVADPRAFEAHSREQIRQRVAEWLSYVVRKYGSRPEFVHGTKNGRQVPVIFLYAATLFSPTEWREIFSRVQAATGVDPFYQGDVGSGDFEVAGQAFDGVHQYAPVDGAEALLGTAARALGRSWAATVMPGFDDRLVRSGGSRLPRDHGAERTYDWFWRRALSSGPDWVLITSFNEWHEGTEIEPSKQFGTEFITRTRRWSDRMHACSPGTSVLAGRRVGVR